MRFLSFLFFSLMLLPALNSFSQKIIYADPDADDNHRMTFDIVGKVSGNFLVYKKVRNKNYIVAYDNDMKQVAKEVLEDIPYDQLINVDFFSYSDHAYLVYEYQKKNVVYCNAIKIDGLGKKQGEVMQLDTSHISVWTTNKVYSTICSEDRNSIMLFKINSRNRNRYVLTTVLLNNNLALRKRSVISIPMEDRDDYIGDLTLDNDGDLALCKFIRVNNDNIGKTWLMWKPAMSDTLGTIELATNKLYLDELHLKADNPNKRFLVSSFYFGKKKGDVDGIYIYLWDKATQKPLMEKTTAFSEDLRKEAKGDATAKTAFDDYFIRNIIMKKDGGFLLGTEAYYTTSRMNNWNRNDYLYGFPGSYNDYYSSPYYNSWYWRNRMAGNSQALRYHADNIAILSFDKEGKMDWSNVMIKSQFNDESDDLLSYQVVNTGGQLHFLFNMDEKRTLLLNDYVLSPDGQVNRNPTLKNLDRNFDFMPKYAKQVSARQVIIPCYYRNYICFAKVEY